MGRVEEQAPKMTLGVAAEGPAVIRTGRGLTIAGTRITLYQILDYLKAGWSPGQIQYLHRLTDAQMAGSLASIESHRPEVGSDYEIVLRRAEEIRAYWEEQNRGQPTATGAMPARPDREELRSKLEAWKKRLSQEP